MEELLCWAFALSLTFCPSLVHAACTQAPIAESPKELFNFFVSQMHPLGADVWISKNDMPSDTIYYSEATAVRYYIKINGNLVYRTGLILPDDATDGDTSVLKAVAVSLAAYISKAPEDDLRNRVVRAIARARQSGTGNAILERNTVLTISSPSNGAVVVELSKFDCR